MARIRSTFPSQLNTYPAQILVGYAAAHFLGEWGQHHERDMRIEFVEQHRLAESLADVHSGHGDDKVVLLGGKLGAGLFIVGHFGKSRRRGKIERDILVVYLFLHATVLLEHEGIVGRGHKKHIEDALLHKILKSRLLEVETAQYRFIYIFHHGRISGRVLSLF